MLTVFSLSPKGIQARQSERTSLPAELRQLLHLVDGRRTRGELLTALRKSALVAGGLRWLEAAGYIHARRPAPGASQPAGVAKVAESVPAPVAVPDFMPASAPVSAPACAEARGEADKFHPVLSRYMLRAVGRWLGESGHDLRRRIESAASVEQLVPHLHSLTDIIATRAGAQAGADFAENAAFILERLAGRTVRASLESTR